jgi:hypothetical protein
MVWEAQVAAALTAGMLVGIILEHSWGVFDWLVLRLAALLCMTVVRECRD